MASVDGNSSDPRQRLGPEVFLHVISHLESSRDITAAEAVHSTWRDLIVDCDRTIWLPEARRLGIKEEVIARDAEHGVRALCRARCITKRNKQQGRSKARVYEAAGELDEGPWRVKVDDQARVAWITSRSDSYTYMSIDLDNDMPMVQGHIGRPDSAYAHLEAADGYLMITVTQGRSTCFQLLRTSTAVEFERQQGRVLEPNTIARGQAELHHLLDPPTNCNASRMRSVSGSGPIFCAAGKTAAHFWDVQSGALLSTIEFGQDGGQPIRYIEFNTEYLFVINLRTLLIYNRYSSTLLVRGFVPTVQSIHHTHKCMTETGASISPIVPVKTRETPIQVVFPSSVHDSADELVILGSFGYIFVVSAYKAMLRQLASKTEPAYLLEQGNVFCIKTNLVGEILHVDPEYAMVQSQTGLYSLSLKPFRGGYQEDHHLRLLSSTYADSNLLGEQPSAVQSTDSAVYFVHGRRHGFVLRELDFSPQPDQVFSQQLRPYATPYFATFIRRAECTNKVSEIQDNQPQQQSMQMPVAMSDGHSASRGLPTSPGTKMTKGDFFRARSPPLDGRAGTQSMLQSMMHSRPDSPRESSRGHAIAGENSVEGNIGHSPAIGSSSPAGRSPSLSSRGHGSPISSPGLVAGLRGALSAPDDPSSPPRGLGNRELKEATVMNMAGGSDEMLMSLLAGQAAMDCENLPIKGWEEVESWKKELSVLSSRLTSLVSRHQRELKIVTAARTLQKLNTGNKRMSKQTGESLEQAERRAEEAEKDVFLLRDREAILRRQLMEHWAGVMAWEVRRLERVASEAQQRATRQARRMSVSRDRERELVAKIEQSEAELEGRRNRVEELEMMVQEMGRREQGLEVEMRKLDDERSHWDTERRQWDQQRRAWQMERESLAQTGSSRSVNNVQLEQVRGGLGEILGRRNGVIDDSAMAEAVDEVKTLVKRREREIVSLRDEMKEVNMGLEEELRRAAAERDLWKNKVEEEQSARQSALTDSERQQRVHIDRISDLNLHNETLKASLTAAQAAASAERSPVSRGPDLQSKVDALTAELTQSTSTLQKIWHILPSPDRRYASGLADARTGKSNVAAASPSAAVNFAALQQLYSPGAPAQSTFNNPDEVLARIRGMVDDGKILVERIVRHGTERELLKNNAARAGRLVEESRSSLATYQRQVAVLEDRLASTGSSESKLLDELNELRAALDAAHSAKRQLEVSAAQQAETCERLSQANDSLSSRALTLADEAEQEKRKMQKKLEKEIDDLKAELDGSKEDLDDIRARSQSQRIQLLDELNSLQAEVGDLRKQLRSVQRTNSISSR